MAPGVDSAATSGQPAVGSGWSLDPLAERVQAANQVTGGVLPIVSDATMAARLAGTSPYTAILLYKTGEFRPAVDPIVAEQGDGTWH